MLRLPPFVYKPAESVDHAVALLNRHGGDCLPVAGGTDLYANMKQRLFTPKVVVGLSSIAPLRYIAYNELTGLTMGALATISQIAASDVVRRYYPALAQAAAAISTPQLRNMGTIGGNVCVDTRCNYYNQNLDWRQALGFCMKKDGEICRVAPSSPKCVAVNSSDTAPVLQAFGGMVHLAGPSGQRDVSVGDFYLADGINAWARRPDEIVTAISLPPPGPFARSAYRKLRLRHSFDFPILGVAAVLHLDEEGVCVAARIVLNAIASRPLEARAAAQRLVGSKLEPEALDAAAEAAYALGKPLDNTSGSIPYRKRMIRVFTRRTLADIAGQATAL
ncbi:MAG: FAD binding domain-containing protein [Candidatus Eremiobacteraeota bacterium]|nr:FAD binding domain-containing protein [Candidatus Eremiobacteraeota bacterium]MBC5827081.1 FAD binding domain-containing protein [Candidatus Eremiobacteraeota bacterium]